MENNPFAIEGKTILITGASSGIGAATAIQCAFLGALVIATGRNEDRLTSTVMSLKGYGHRQVVCDLSDNESMNTLVSSLPVLDGVVLCAGINKTLPIGFCTRKKIDQIFETNFFSQIELFRQLVKKKLLSEGASVVALSSIGGTTVFTPGASAYGASKAAFLSWMKTAARELAPRIRINCICPGAVNTPMNAASGISEEQYDSYVQSIPMKRFADPIEVAYGIAYLLSDASRYVTGSTLTIDGGASI